MNAKMKIFSLRLKQCFNTGRMKKEGKREREGRRRLADNCVTVVRLHSPLKLIVDANSKYEYDGAINFDEVSISRTQTRDQIFPHFYPM